MHMDAQISSLSNKYWRSLVSEFVNRDEEVLHCDNVTSYGLMGDLVKGIEN